MFTPFKKEKSLEDILGGFTKVVAELDDLEKKNAAQFQENFDTIVKLGEENNALKAESEKAAAVRANIQSLLAPVQ